MTIEQEKEVFADIVKEMQETFARKRHDYGQTTEETLKKFGPTSLLVRIYDKFGRLENLLSDEKEMFVKEESIRDTFLDMANYCIISIIELQKRDDRLKCDNNAKSLYANTLK